MNSKRYKIRLDNKTEVTVLEHQLFREKWINYFGSLDAVLEFIKNYEKDK